MEKPDKQVVQLLQRGNELFKIGDYRAATSAYESIIAATPDFAEAHHNLGAALLRMGNADEAAASFCSAIRFQPGLAEAHNHLGVALSRLGRSDEA